MGETSADIVKEPCGQGIFEHFERWAISGEADATVLRRPQAALRSGTIPIVCVGETLQGN